MDHYFAFNQNRKHNIIYLPCLPKGIKDVTASAINLKLMSETYERVVSRLVKGNIPKPTDVSIMSNQPLRLENAGFVSHLHYFEERSVTYAGKSKTY